MATGVASAGGSVLAYGLIAWWRRHKDKTKVCGAVLSIGKSYAEHNLIEDEKTVFIDLDGAVSITPIRQVEKSKLRLEIYPKAKDHAAKMIQQFKNRRVVLCSGSMELLKYVGVKEKRIHALLPNKKFVTDNEDKVKTIDFKALELERLHQEIEIPKMVRHYFGSFDELTTKLINIFKQVK